MNILPTYTVVVNDDDAIDFISFVKNPATEKNMLKFSEEEHKKYEIKCSEQRDRRVVIAPIALAGVPIYRREGDFEYQIVFEKEAIEKMAKNYFKFHRQTNFDIEHNWSYLDGVHVYQSMLVDSELGVTAPKGFEDIPDGSWVVAAYVNNAEIWDDIKSGKYDGLSLAGMFDLEKLTLSEEDKEDSLEEQMKNIYKNLAKL